MENSTGRQELFVRKQKYGILEGLNDHKISTLSGITLKICILANSNSLPISGIYKARVSSSPIMSHVTNCCKSPIVMYESLLLFAIFTNPIIQFILGGYLHQNN